MNETNAKKDCIDTINFMLKELRKHMAEPEYIYLPNDYGFKEREIKKAVKFLQKDIAKRLGMKRKKLFGKYKK